MKKMENLESKYFMPFIDVQISKLKVSAVMLGILFSLILGIPGYVISVQENEVLALIIGVIGVVIAICIATAYYYNRVFTLYMFKNIANIGVTLEHQMRILNDLNTRHYNATVQNSLQTAAPVILNTPPATFAVNAERCASCGNELKSDSKFCAVCGASKQ